MNHSFFLQNEAELLQFGQQLASVMRSYLATHHQASLVVYLNGELGAGKTTLTRSIVRDFGHQGNVKSPTYTLVEEYHLDPFVLYHFDLYRLASPEELEFMGIRDYFRPQTLCLLEWASRGEGMIEPADLVIDLAYQQQGRQLQLFAQNVAGQHILSTLLANLTACSER